MDASCNMQPPAEAVRPSSASSAVDFLDIRIQGRDSPHPSHLNRFPGMHMESSDAWGMQFAQQVLEANSKEY